MSDYANKLLRHSVEQANKEYEELHRHCEARIAALERQLAEVMKERDALKGVIDIIRNHLDRKPSPSRWSETTMSSYKSEHCPGCEDSGFEDCPGVTCPACAEQAEKATSAWRMWDTACHEIAEKDAEIAKAHEALDGANVARGAFGHSLRYRIGLLKADQDESEKMSSSDIEDRLARNLSDRLTLQHQVDKLQAEIARLRALVAVGREMVEWLEQYENGMPAIEEWRSLEGK